MKMSYLLQVDHIEKDINCTLDSSWKNYQLSAVGQLSRDSKLIYMGWWVRVDKMTGRLSRRPQKN